MYYIEERFAMNKRNFIIQEMYLSTDIGDAIGKMQPRELQDDLLPSGHRPNLADSGGVLKVH